MAWVALTTDQSEKKILKNTQSALLNVLDFHSRGLLINILRSKEKHHGKKPTL